MSFDQLETFLDVAELGGFSAAAERLGVSQPAVSLQVRQLERRLGVRLIDRVGKRAAPTAAGSELIRHARLIRASVADAVASVSPYASGVAGRVRLGTGATACTYVLPDVLRGLRRRFPELEIAVRIGNSAHILRDVAENALDLGLVTLPAPGRMFDVTPVLDDEFVLIAPQDAAPDKKTVTPADLSGAPLVFYEPADHTRRLVDEWFARAGETPNIVMELGSTEAMKRLVGAGLGSAIVPRVALRGEGAVAIRRLEPCVTRTLAIVVRRDKMRSWPLRETIAALGSAAAPA